MIEHRPMRPLFEGEGLRRRHIGYECGHCGALFTPAMSPSIPLRPINHNPGFQARWVDSRSHQARMKAAKKGRRRARRKAAA